MDEGIKTMRFNCECNVVEDARDDALHCAQNRNTWADRTDIEQPCEQNSCKSQWPAHRDTHLLRRRVGPYTEQSTKQCSGEDGHLCSVHMEPVVDDARRAQGAFKSSEE